jgi:hypothetical protein
MEETMRQHCSTLAFTIALAAVAACAPKEATKDQAVATDSAATTATAPAEPAVITVHAADFKFEGPDTIPAGMVTFHLINDGTTFHHLQMVRLDSAKTFADLQAAIAKPGPIPGWVTFVGGPNAPDPKSESNATMNMPAGNYAMLCFVDVPGGVPHVAKGMERALTVVPSVSNIAAPKPDVTLTLSDYSFETSQPLHAGRQVIEVRNNGPQLHEVELIRLAPGKTQQEVLAWMQKPNGPPPGSGIGGVAGAAPGEVSYFTADLTPGNYLLICFLPDRKDGKPHFMKGMLKTVTVS